MINNIIVSVGAFCLGYSLTGIYGIDGLILALGFICLFEVR